MNFNYSIKSHISKRFYIYILAIVAASVSLSLLVSLRTKLSPKQIFNVFISVSQLDVDQTKFKNSLNPYINDEIKDFAIHAFSTNSMDYSKMYSTVGVNSDLLILGESALTIIDSRQFVLLPDAYKNSFNYVKDEKPIGYRIYDGNSGKLDDVIKYGKEKYYAFANTTSVHLLNFSNAGETSIIADIFAGLLK